MAKPHRTVTECEECGALIDLASPPLREYYKRGQVHIDDGMVLLDKPNESPDHGASLVGRYCDLNCLMKKIKELRRGYKIDEALTTES